MSEYYAARKKDLLPSEGRGWGEGRNQLKNLHAHIHNLWTQTIVHKAGIKVWGGEEIEKEWGQWGKRGRHL